MSPVLFSLFPNLHTLHTHPNGVIRIPLFNLVELRLANPCKTQRSSMESVLTMLRNTCRLEVLHLMGFAQFSHVSTTVKPVELGKLKFIKFTDCHLPELLPQLCFPQLHEFSFCGSDFTPDENTPPPQPVIPTSSPSFKPVPSQSLINKLSPTSPYQRMTKVTRSDLPCGWCPNRPVPCASL